MCMRRYSDRVVLWYGTGCTAYDAQCQYGGQESEGVMGGPDDRHPQCPATDGKEEESQASVTGHRKKNEELFRVWRGLSP